MPILIASFLAGILTVAAPCILPLLPIIIGGSVNSKNNTWRRAFWINIGLGGSVLVFSLLLKATTILISVPSSFWQILSGSIVVLLGLQFIYPKLWLSIALKIKLESTSNRSLAKASNRPGIIGAILTGAALGPVFSSCSPTYAFIVAVALPSSFTIGLAYLMSYVFGLTLTMFLIALLGQKIVSKLSWLANDKKISRRLIGIMFVIVGVAVLLGIDKQVQTLILDKGLYNPVQNLEDILR